jgi:hypothetical protein
MAMRHIDDGMHPIPGVLGKAVCVERKGKKGYLVERLDIDAHGGIQREGPPEIMDQAKLSELLSR